MKTALITGVTGQDGSYLAELLLSYNYTVIGIHRKPIIKVHSSEDNYFKNISSIINNKNFILEYADLLDATSMWKVLKQYQPDEVYNLAAQSHVNLSFETSEITTQVNAVGVLHLLNAIIDVVPKTHFFQASSSDMYGNNKEEKLDEQSLFSPNTPYGASKLFAHNLVNIYRKKYNLFSACGICFNHESPRRGMNFATQKIAQGAAKIKLGLSNKLFLGNLNVSRDWGHAKDFAKAMWFILQQNKADDFVIATGESNTLESFVRIIFDYAGLNFEEFVCIDSQLYRNYEKNYISSNPKKLNNLGWEHKTSFEDIAIEMFEKALGQFK